MWQFIIPAAMNTVGSFMGANAQNKATKEQNQLQREALQLGREQDRRAAEADIFKKLAQMAYIQGGGANTEPVSFNTTRGPRTLQSFGFGPTAPSQTEMNAAREMEQQLMMRLRQPVTPMSMPPAVSGSQSFLRMIGKPEAAQKLEEFIRSRTTTPGY